MIFVCLCDELVFFSTFLDSSFFSHIFNTFYNIVILSVCLCDDLFNFFLINYHYSQSHCTSRHWIRKRAVSHMWLSPGASARHVAAVGNRLSCSPLSRRASCLSMAALGLSANVIVALVVLISRGTPEHASRSVFWTVLVHV